MDNSSDHDLLIDAAGQGGFPKPDSPTFAARLPLKNCIPPADDRIVAAVQAGLFAEPKADGLRNASLIRKRFYRKHGSTVDFRRQPSSAGNMDWLQTSWPVPNTQ